jgi:hypothetical protein
MFSAPGLIFTIIQGVGSRFHALRARTHFWWYRRRRDPLSFFALPDSFSAKQRASGPLFMICAPGLIFGGSEGIRSQSHVLRDRTLFRRYRGRWLSFSCLALLDSFLAVSRTSSPVFMFLAPGVVSRDTEGVRTRFHFLRSQTRFRRY